MLGQGAEPSGAPESQAVDPGASCAEDHPYRGTQAQATGKIVLTEGDSHKANTNVV